MKVIFKTNLDKYKCNCFPTNLEIPPRIGEQVKLAEVFVDFYQRSNLPITLEVVDVTWTEEGVICDLWYRAQDIQIYKEEKLF